MTDIRVHEIFSRLGEQQFNEIALQVFHYQARENKVYASYLDLIGKTPDAVTEPEEIPFLPVSLFKTHRVVSFREKEEAVFLSSTTTSAEPSRHYVYNLALYEQSFLKCFQDFYGPLHEWIILALLPSYLEREGSSLVYMVDRMIRHTGSSESGFYLNDHKKLYDQLVRLGSNEKNVLLLGVSYALLDFAEKYEISIPHLTVMETGGMKGRRKELVREELHEILKNRFHVSAIHSEYGMTELLSQAYSRGRGVYTPPPWVKVFIRDAYDPFTLLPTGRHGGINIIDLANIYSCSFIETGDVGLVYPDGSFTVSGRFDHAELRGCNLMVQEI